MQGFVGVCILVICSLRKVLCFSDGPPISACKSMMPLHGVVAQTSAPPFAIITPSSTYCPGQRVQVTLEAKNVSYYAGVFVQARYHSAPHPVGKWVAFDKDRMKTLNCGDQFESAISHSNSDTKHTEKLIWKAPMEASEDVTFVGTFVKEAVEFWTNVKSESLSLGVCSASNMLKKPSSYILYSIIIATPTVIKML